MDRPRRSPLRLLAPLAIVSFALALVVVVATAGTGPETPDRAAEQAEQRDLGGGEEEATTTEEASAEEDEDADEGPPGDVYIVKPGDTLGAISEQVGISVEQLQQLNPEIDPQALVSGQQIKLRE